MKRKTIEQTKVCGGDQEKERSKKHEGAERTRCMSWPAKERIVFVSLYQVYNVK